MRKFSYYKKNILYNYSNEALLCVKIRKYFNNSRSLKIRKREVNECLLALSDVNFNIFATQKSRKRVVKPMLSPCETKGIRRWNQGFRKVKPWVSQNIFHFFEVFIEANRLEKRASHCCTTHYLFQPSNRPEEAQMQRPFRNFKTSAAFSITFLTIQAIQEAYM